MSSPALSSEMVDRPPGQQSNYQQKYHCLSDKAIFERHLVSRDRRRGVVNASESEASGSGVQIRAATRLTSAISSRIKNGTELYSGLFQDKCPPK